MQDRPAIVTMGAAIVRNIFSIVGFGAYWVPAKDLLPWKDAGWGPLLLDITGACDPGGWYQDGPYCAYFVGMGFTLLGALPRYRGKSKEEGRRFAANLLDLTLQLSVPDDSPAALSHSRVRGCSWRGGEGRHAAAWHRAFVTSLLTSSTQLCSLHLSCLLTMALRLPSPCPAATRPFGPAGQRAAAGSGPGACLLCACLKY